MASFADLQEAVGQWMKENITRPDTGNFFQTRTTRTPGMVMPLDRIFDQGAAGTYTPTDDPAAIVRASQLNKALRDNLASQWDGQKGFIRIDPRAAQNSRILRHEQVHDVYTKGGLADNIGQIDPMLATGFKNYVNSNPLYSQNSPAERVNEELAYQLTTPDEQELASKISAILANKGKTTQARQIKELSK